MVENIRTYNVQCSPIAGLREKSLMTLTSKVSRSGHKATLSRGMEFFASGNTFRLHVDSGVVQVGVQPRELVGTGTGTAANLNNVNHALLDGSDVVHLSLGTPNKSIQSKYQNTGKPWHGI